MADFHQDINRIPLNAKTTITQIELQIFYSEFAYLSLRALLLRKNPLKCLPNAQPLFMSWLRSWSLVDIYIYLFWFLILHNKCDPRCICSWCYTPSSYSQTTQYKDNTFSWSKFLVFWILFSKTTKQNSLVDIAVRKKELGYISLTMLHKR